jgi:predicted RNA-binding protein with PIN domain
MPELPDDVAQTLVRSIGAYVRTTDPNELPARLRPVKKAAQTAKGLTRHRSQLLAMLDDDALRARLLEWLDKGKPSLSKYEALVLRAALVGEEGWLEKLASPAVPKPARSDGQDEITRIEKRLERERETARLAKDEARSARVEKAKAVEAEAVRGRALAKELSETQARISELERELRDARSDVSSARKEVERLRRNVKRMEQKAEVERDRLRARLKTAEESVRELKASSSPRPERAAPRTKAVTKSRGPRRILKAPKGRLDDDPETLDSWLRRDDVHLVVDGYNVTRHEKGFAHLELEQQRDRLIEMVKVFATGKKVDATIVFDGSEVPPGTRRRRHGSVTVEYSKPDRSGKGTDRDRADDHIVELIQRMPPEPVVVVTNDNELRERVGELKATPARSEQLLALLR